MEGGALGVATDLPLRNITIAFRGKNPVQARLESIGVFTKAVTYAGMPRM